MEIFVKNIFNKEDISNVINFATTLFSVTEKESYNKHELKLASECYKNLDVLNEGELLTRTKKGEVNIFAAVIKNQMVGVSAVEISSGKILFFSVINNEEKILNMLIESMIEARASHPSSVLYIMAPKGIQQILNKIGFTNLYDTVLYYKNLKLVPMKYTYTQLDIEK